MRLEATLPLFAALCRGGQAAAPHAPPPVLLQSLLSPGSVCADKADARFYAGRRDEACPCDCLGCRCNTYVACWDCDPPPCRRQAFYECERGAGSYFNELTQECSWLPLRTPPFDCPLAPPFPPSPPWPPAPPPRSPPPPSPPRPPRPPMPGTPAFSITTTLVQPTVTVTQPIVTTGGLGVGGVGIGGVGGVGVGGVGGVGVGGLGVGSSLFSPAGLTPGFTPALGAVGGVGNVGLPGQLGVGGISGTGFSTGGITTTVTSPAVTVTGGGQATTPATTGAGSCPADGSICGQCLVPQGAAPGKYVCCCDRACKSNNAAQDPAGSCCANFATACPGQQ